MQFWTNVIGGDVCTQPTTPAGHSTVKMGDNTLGYRYTCWPSLNKTTSDCTNYLLGTTVEITSNGTVQNDPTPGHASYLIYDGEPCYSAASCGPPGS